MRKTIRSLLPLLLASLLLFTGCAEGGGSGSLEHQSAASVSSELHLVRPNEKDDSSDT